jgi:hypothetical protein
MQRKRVPKCSLCFVTFSFLGSNVKVYTKSASDLRVSLDGMKSGLHYDTYCMYATKGDSVA